MPPTTSRLAAVPVVGARFRVYNGTATITVICDCVPTNAPLLIRAADLASVCQACQAVYGITRIEFDRARGDRYPTFDVGVVGKIGSDGAMVPVLGRTH